MKTLIKKISLLLTVLLGRAGLLYLAVFLFSLPFTNYNAAFLQAQASTLSRFMPNFTYLLDFRDGRAELNKAKMQEYLEYFRKVDRYVPGKADVQAILGYCSYYHGQKKESLRFFKKSLHHFSGSFSANYNLGALHFQKGEYPQAKSYLTTALRSNPLTELRFISSSRIYFPLIRDHKDAARELTEYAKLGYERCYRLLILTCEALNQLEDELNFALQAAASDFQTADFFLLKGGIAAHKLGRYEQAIVLLQRSLQKKPQNAEALRYLGLSLQALNNDAAAKELLRQAEILRTTTKEETKKAEDIILQIY